MGDNNPKTIAHPVLGDESLLRDRVAEAIVAGGGVSVMAEKTGIPLGTMNKYSTRTSTASFTNAARISLAADVALDVIAFGQSPLAAKNVRELGNRLRTADRWLNDHPDLIRLPMFNEVRASAGPGVVPTSERTDSVVSFDRQFLRDRGAVPERCSVIETRGDSMQPTIPDGSLLIVDHSQTDVSGGAIYVIGVSDTVLVKRVRLRFDGTVELASDNTAYAPEIINRDQLADLRVIGKVVYYCRTP